jgi:hypothetical protein
MRFVRGIAIGTVVALAILEALFRCMPVNSGFRMAETDAATPFFRYLSKQDYVYSYGWALTNPKRGVTNAQGFMHSPDFESQGGVLVIGDSFVESLMLDYQETVQGRLDHGLGGNVLAASCSGNGLADSLGLAKFYVPKVHPKAMVLFVAPLEISTVLNSPVRGHSGFVLSGETVSVLHNEYRESPLKLLIRRSALARYVYYNLKFFDWLSQTLTISRAPLPSAAPARVEAKERILRYYFSELRALADAGQAEVLFLVDGDRKSIYAGKANQPSSSNNEDRRVFLRLAPLYGLKVVDMQPVFERHWMDHHERMDYLPVDGHWNPVAHQLAARELLKHMGKN